MISVPKNLIFTNADKLKSILDRRGSDWGFSGPATLVQIKAFQEVVARHVSEAAEVWQAKYRGSDRLFFIVEDKVVVVHLDGTFESAWRATTEQLVHYRTGVKIR